MRKPEAFLEFTRDAKRDIERSRLFLWRTPGGQPAKRVREIEKECGRLTTDPKLHPIVLVHPVSGLEIRRKNVGKFIIFYAYIEPSPASPQGIVSVRAIRHGAAEDVSDRVEDSRASAFARPAFARMRTSADLL